ncbi:hypothetical protein GCM10010205_06870 [Streptomyces nojiriensis]|nr:hypothetical protein GCM10010205_06870 [Streptomyces nojiriensis]
MRNLVVPIWTGDAVGARPVPRGAGAGRIPGTRDAARGGAGEAVPDRVTGGRDPGRLAA